MCVCVCVCVSKMQKMKPSIYALLNIIKDKIHTEKYILYQNCQFKEFDKYWHLGPDSLKQDMPIY